MDYTEIECINEKIEGYECRLLLRKEGNNPLIVIGLNPSTADESTPDATMRKLWDLPRLGIKVGRMFMTVSLCSISIPSGKRLQVN